MVRVLLGVAGVARDDYVSELHEALQGAAEVKIVVTEPGRLLSDSDTDVVDDKQEWYQWRKV